jgi:hypothetical protein
MEDLSNNMDNQELAVVVEMLAYLPTACKTIAKAENTPTEGNGMH